MPPIIKVENLSKKYTIAHEHPERYVALRDVMAQKAKKLFSFPQQIKRSVAKTDYEEFWALKDLNFEINQGDRVGIIGRNGAGKSTLLKLLSRIVEPSSGRITLNGRVASLLEVGTGFHPELTGRENIFLNGAILGMSRSEIRKKFDEIVDFSGVEKFLDTPVKRYSSGMYVRLAFAVAAHLEPEILVVDEVLAVGDAEFQRKCLGKMEDVSKNEGRTVLFVSHNLNAISSLCKTGIVLKNGKIITNSIINECIHRYASEIDGDVSSEWTRKHEILSPSIKSIYLGLFGKQPQLKLNIRLTVVGNKDDKKAFVAFDIQNGLGTTIMQAIPKNAPFISFESGEQSYSIEVELPGLIPDTYTVSVWLGPHNSETYDFIRDVVKFKVDDSPSLDRIFPHTHDHGSIVPKSIIVNKL